VVKDLIGFGGGINFYNYATNDPINFLDSTGYAPCGAGLELIEKTKDFLKNHGFGSLSIRGGYIIVGALDVSLSNSGVKIYIGAGLGAGLSASGTVGFFAGSAPSGLTGKTTIIGGNGIAGKVGVVYGQSGVAGHGSVGTGAGVSVTSTVGCSLVF